MRVRGDEGALVIVVHDEAGPDEFFAVSALLPGLEEVHILG